MNKHMSITRVVSQTHSCWSAATLIVITVFLQPLQGKGKDAERIWNWKTNLRRYSLLFV